MNSLLSTHTLTNLLSLALAALAFPGCHTWEGFGKDIGGAGDSMAGKGEYVMTVSGTPTTVTAAASKAVEQLQMDNIETSGDWSHGKVTAKTSQKDAVRIDIEQSGESESKVTIHTHGDNADAVGNDLQAQIHRNLM